MRAHWETDESHRVIPESDHGDAPIPLELAIFNSRWSLRSATVHTLYCLCSGLLAFPPTTLALLPLGWLASSPPPHVFLLVLGIQLQPIFLFLKIHVCGSRSWFFSSLLRQNVSLSLALACATWHDFSFLHWPLQTFSPLLPPYLASLLACFLPTFLSYFEKLPKSLQVSGYSVCFADACSWVGMFVVVEGKRKWGRLVCIS